MKFDVSPASDYPLWMPRLVCVGDLTTDHELPVFDLTSFASVTSDQPSHPLEIELSTVDGLSCSAKDENAAQCSAILPAAQAVQSDDSIAVSAHARALADGHAPIIAPVKSGAYQGDVTPPPAPIGTGIVVTPAKPDVVRSPATSSIAKEPPAVHARVDMTQFLSDDDETIEVAPIPVKRRTSSSVFTLRKSSPMMETLEESIPKPRTEFHQRDNKHRIRARPVPPDSNLCALSSVAAKAACKMADDSHEPQCCFKLEHQENNAGLGLENVVITANFEEGGPVEPEVLRSDDVESNVLENASSSYEKSLGRIRCNKAKACKDGTLIFSFKYGAWAWDVSHTTAELVHLAHTLQLKMFMANIVEGNKKRKASIAQLCTEVDAFRLRTAETDAQVSPRDVKNFLNNVRRLLTSLLRDRKVSKASAMMEFMEVSWLSFDSNRSQKYREGFILKTRGGRKYRQNAVTDVLKCGCVLDTTKSRFGGLRKLFRQTRWLMILDDALCYADKNDLTMKFRSVMWFDPSIQVMAGLAETGSAGGLIVKNQYRILKMEAATEDSALKWKKAIEDVASSSLAGRKYRFNSFAQVHGDSQVRLLVDGQAYYDALYDVLEEATQSIYLSDWWMTPTILLRRCGTSEDSLINILKRKAEEGVMIRITLYKEVESVIYNSSRYASRMLTSAHKNIQVQRHPDHGVRGTLFWSHHEKVVVVDMETSFIGGLDLCLGRYDNAAHTLIDCDRDHQVFPGKDYSNPVIKDFFNVTKPDIDMLDRDTEPRMPWHDVHCMIKSKAFSRDLAKHFMQLWNHIITDKNKFTKPHLDYLTLGAVQRAPRASKALILRDHLVSRLSSRRRRSAGDLTCRENAKDSHNDTAAQRRFSDTAVRQSIHGDPAAESRSTLARHTEGCTAPAWSAVQQSQAIAQSRPRRITSRSLMPRTGFKKMARGFGFIRSASHGAPMIDRREVVDKDEHTPTFMNCFVQFVRSSSLWSNGLLTDSSIHSAYITLIQNAEKFIYIENQFFVTSTHRGNNNLRIKNRIGEALVSKIEEKNAQNLPFKVYIVMPTMPAFEADAFASELAWQCRQTMHTQYQSIIDTPNSVIGALQDSLPNSDDWEDYVIFCSLRQVESTPDGVVHATQIYIHSKCAIFDDEHVIIGSANINDRSMLGSRDSETAVVISNKDFARSTRMRLWSEHFNVLKKTHETPGVSRELVLQMLSDPLNPACWNWWIGSASRMEQVLYERLHVWPSSQMQVWEDYHACVAKRKNMIATLKRRDWHELLEEIKTETFGSHVVLFPLYFFLKEDIRFPRPAIARVVSTKVFA